MNHSRIRLNDAIKTFTLDQDKTLPPEETVRRFRDKLKHLNLDILESTRRIDNGRLGIPVYFSTCGKDAAAMIGTRKQMGKGATPQQAEASAVMELAERYSFFSFSQNTEKFFTQSHVNLKEKAISFDQIARSVHDDSEDMEISRKIFENLPLRWTWGYNLTRQESVLIPFDWFFTINEFNGSSAGNCTEEALTQGICEITERHVSSLVSQKRLKLPAIDPDSSTDPMVRDMIQKYRHIGVKFYLSDFSLDTGIPTVGILAYDPTTFPEKSEIVWTAGTTSNPEKALSRSLTEVAQLAGDFNTGANYMASGLPKFTRLEDTNFITRADQTIAITDLPDVSDNNIRTEVENLVAVLAKNHMEVFAVNITHPLLEVPAYYIIIPGSHFRERALGTSVGMFSARLIAENQHPEMAVRELKKMESMLPGKYYVKFYMGLSSLSAGDPLAALDYFHQALDLDPNTQDIPSIYSYMGVCLKDMGQYQEALKVLQKGERFDAERTDIYNLMGFCHFKLKAHEQAISCFQKVIRLDPGSAIDYANIASNYRDMGQTEKAIEYYQTALAIDPSIDFARDNLEKLIS